MRARRHGGVVGRGREREGQGVKGFKRDLGGGIREEGWGDRRGVGFETKVERVQMPVC